MKNSEELEEALDIINKYLKDSRNIQLLINSIKKINNQDVIEKLREYIKEKKSGIDELSVIYKTRYQYVDKLLNHSQ